MSDDLMARFLALRPHERRALLAGTAGTAIPRRPRTGWPARFPASPGQQAQYVLWRMDPHGSGYHVPACYDVRGPVNPALLAAAADAVVARHEMLRTTFAEEGAGVVQVVHREGRADVRAATAANRREALALAAAAARAPFDLRNGPLLRVRLWRYADDRHLLMIALHHIAVDERSSRIVEQELSAYYAAAVADRPAALPPLPLQYGDYAAWQDGLDWAPGIAYWSKQLGGAPRSPLPPDRPWPETAHLRGETVETRISDGIRALDRLAEAAGCTRFTALAAVFALFLATRTDEPEAVFGLPVACRTSGELERLIGYFMNTVVLRVPVADERDPARLARTARRAVEEALRHQEVPFQHVVAALRANRTPFRNPLFDSMLVYLSGEQTGHRVALAPGVPMAPVVLPLPNAHRYTIFAFVEEPAGLTLTVRYPAEVYHRATVEGWIRELTALLAEACQQPILESTLQ